MQVVTITPDQIEIAVDIDALYRALEPQDLHPLLFAGLPQRTGDGLQAAELLTLDPAGPDLRAMT